MINNKEGKAFWPVIASEIDVILLIVVIAAVGLIVSHVFWAIAIHITLAELNEERDFNQAVTVLRLPMGFIFNETNCTNTLLDYMGYDSIQVADRPRQR